MRFCFVHRLQAPASGSQCANEPLTEPEDCSWKAFCKPTGGCGCGQSKSVLQFSAIYCTVQAFGMEGFILAFFEASGEPQGERWGDRGATRKAIRTFEILACMLCSYL